MGNIDFSHGGNIHQLKGGYKGKITDFSASINPLGLSKAARQAVSENIDNILHYPDPWAESLTAKIASYWNIKKENILLGNGSAELIYLIANFFKPKKAVIPAPTFSEYERALAPVKSRIQFLKLKEKDNFALNIFSKIKTDMLFICNPNNPTGNLLVKHRERKSFPAKLTVIDEVFMDFLRDEEKHTYIRQACRNKNILVLRTFTKFFALPGLRAGYLTAHSDLIRKLKANGAPWSINIFAQKLAEIMLGSSGYIKDTRQFIEAEKTYLSDGIKKIKDLKVYPSSANFLLVKIENKKISSSFLKEKLIQKGILIRDCSNFRNLNDKFIRVAVRGRQENVKLIAALKAVFGSVKSCMKE